MNPNSKPSPSITNTHGTYSSKSINEHTVNLPNYTLLHSLSKELGEDFVKLAPTLHASWVELDNIVKFRQTHQLLQPSSSINMYDTQGTSMDYSIDNPFENIKLKEF